MQQLDLFGIAAQTKPVAEKQPDKTLSVPDEEMHTEEKGKTLDEVISAVEEKNIVPQKEIVVTYQKHTAEKPVSKRGRKSYKEMDDDIVMVEIPADEILYKKQYYPISEVAEWFHVNASLVRFWENEFDILKPRKNKKGDRLFRPEDVKNLQLIYHLLRQRKYSIEGAKQYLKENKKQADTNMELIYSLTKFRAFLLELKANLGA